MHLKAELSCEMKSSVCEEKIKNVLKDVKGVKNFFINFDQEKVILEMDDQCKVTLIDIQNKIEEETGIKTVIKGIGENFSLISELSGSNNLVGIMRLSQLANDCCFVDGVIDNVQMSQASNHCSINIYQFGDLTGEKYERIGKVYKNIADNVVPEKGRCRIRKDIKNCELTNLVGRCLLISEKESNQPLGAGIISRMSTIEQNKKKICSCSGQTIWEERSDKKLQVLQTMKNIFSSFKVKFFFFFYEEEWLYFNCQDLNTEKSSNQSWFDKILKTKWLEAETKNVFRYRINDKFISKKKIIGKKYSFVSHLNAGRGILKRKPEHISCLKMPFDPNKFNFNKIKKEEVLFKIKHVENNLDAVIAINASPIEFCSSILILYPNLCLPQILTKSSLHLAMSIMALSNSRWLKMGFNSSGAAASVNHLHWHIYYLKSRLMLESVEIVGNLIKDWPLEAFAFEFTSEQINEVADKAFQIIKYCLNETQDSHNLFLTRSCDGKKIRLFIWIRKFIFEVKDNLLINPAFCELSGFFICKSEESFKMLDEQTCVDLIKSVEINLDNYKQFCL